MKFLTGNKEKLMEAQEIFPLINGYEIELEEIQSLSSKDVIEHKLKEAMKKVKGKLIVDDITLEIECLNGLPGTLIKWFGKSIGYSGLSELVSKYGNNKAWAKCTIGYTDGEKIKYFEGIIEGKIVLPRGENGFGWDSIFQPSDFSTTFAEMSLEEKNKISMRKIALDKLKEYIDE